MASQVFEGGDLAKSSPSPQADLPSRRILPIKRPELRVVTKGFWHTSERTEPTPRLLDSADER